MVRLGTKRTSRQKFVRAILFLIFFVVIFSAIYFLPNLLKDDYEADPDTDQNEDVVTHSTETPSEEPPRECTASADNPKSMKLESLDVEGCIQSVGIDQDNRIAVPNNVHVAGWYVNSVKPGEKGLSIVTGHRDGIRTIGIFHTLGELNIGDTIEIEYGDGTIYSFIVKDVRQVSVEESLEVMYYEDPAIESQLNLVTCGGKFNTATGSYYDRIIVILEKM